MSEEKEIDLDGFLSKKIDGFILDIRTFHALWFELSEELNRFGEELTLQGYETVLGKSPNPKLIVLLLLIRTMSNFQGIILLAERGMIIEARTLARSALENLFFIAAIKNDKTFVQKLSDASVKSSRGRIDLITKENMRELLTPELFSQIEAYKDGLTKKGESLLVSEVAKAGGADISKLYLLYRQLSADSAHPSLDSLNRYVAGLPDNDNYIADRPNANSLEIADTLALSCMIMLCVCEVVIELIGVAKMDILAAFQKRLFEMNMALKKKEPIKSSILVE